MESEGREGDGEERRLKEAWMARSCREEGREENGGRKGERETEEGRRHGWREARKGRKIEREAGTL